MLGKIRWGSIRRPKMERSEVCGLPVLQLVLPERIRDKAHLVGKGLHLLSKRGITRVLVPKDWIFWPQLVQNGLRTVDTRAFQCAFVPSWVKFLLKEKDIAPDEATLLLKGEQESGDMERVARLLCPLVRNIAIDVPGRANLAAGLRREFGLPVLPARNVQADLTVFFSPVPMLPELDFQIAGELSLPAEYDPLPILSVLWESGRIQVEDIVLKTAGNVDFP